MALRMLILAFVAALLPLAGRAEEAPVRLYAPEALVETGIFTYILPRFTLKTRVRVDLVSEGDAELQLGSEGQPVFEGLGQVWHLAPQGTPRENAARFAAWLGGEVGGRTVTAYAPEGVALFRLPEIAEQAEAAPVYEGDARLGHEVSRAQCARCHGVDQATRGAGIGSTPSFAVLRGMPDWELRFAGFYTLNPHPAFTIIDEVTEPFPEERPSPIVPIRLSLEELDAMLAYVAAMEAADLGAPLTHQ